LRFGIIASQKDEEKMLNVLKKLVNDEQGGETIEYALLMGLIVIGVIGILGTLGVKVVERWQDISDAMLG
jgi:Flp pilus assembly pilin Flp